MGNTKALEVASNENNEYALGLKTMARVQAREAENLQAAIDKATATYATKLAAAEAMCDLLANTLDFVSAHTAHDAKRKFDTLEAYHAHKAARQPTQDKGE